MSHPLLIANWKMNPATADEAVALARVTERAVQEHNHTSVVIAPPFPFLSVVGSELRYARLGAQGMAPTSSGPFTGSVSGEELVSVGVSYVLIGHSERRMEGETDDQIGRMLAHAQTLPLQPVLCIGESHEVRKAGDGAVQEFLSAQLEALPPDSSSDIVPIIAYEPLWAIGSGSPADPAMAQEMAVFIQESVSASRGYVPAVLYGGSTDVRNVVDFVSQPAVAGVLVGGSSIDSDAFSAMIARTAHVSHS